MSWRTVECQKTDDERFPGLRAQLYIWAVA